MKVFFLVAAITILAVGIVWVARRNTSANTRQTPTNDVRAENLTAPVGLVGSRVIDPPPANVRKSLTPDENSRIIAGALRSTPDFPMMIPQAKSLTLQFGINRGSNDGPPGSRDSDAGRAVYILSGDNTFSCSAYGPNGTLLQGTCRWAMMLDANTGDAIIIAQGPEVFCAAGKLIC